MKHVPLMALVVLAAMPTAGHADNCDEIRAQIDAKYRAGGITSFTLAVVDAESRITGKIVGSCGNGTRRIIFIAGAAPGGVAAPAASAAGATPVTKAAPKDKPKDKPILTECKDGSVSYGGNCGR